MSFIGERGKPLGLGLELGQRRTNILLNIYDLTPSNSYLYPIGFGAFHSAVEISAFGCEYWFGAHPYNTSGIVVDNPRSSPILTLRNSIFIAEITISYRDLQTLIDEMGQEYVGTSYHILSRNCNHFSNDFCKRLCGKQIPGWVNRLAYFASLVHCILPASFAPIPPESQNAITEAHQSFGGVGYVLGMINNTNENENNNSNNQFHTNEVYLIEESIEDRRKKLIEATSKRIQQNSNNTIKIENNDEIQD
eukprot:TRINITY_DN5555_c0_g1_i1.p1 TRINITY_DN5555_c0_g1~~TRINITY_DN5555_c0_g1_i1.p1  ORF type:complete len:250 (-),score=89.93 TRINITY_DN5555_c0_g1_i1:82-831(-)